MTPNIIDLSSIENDEDLQIVSTRTVHCRESRKILGAISTATVNSEAANELERDLCAPERSSSEQAPSVSALKLRSVDFGGSRPRSGLAMLRGTSLPDGALSPRAAADLHRFAEPQTSTPLTSRRMESAVEFDLQAAALEARLRGTIESPDVPANDPAIYFSENDRAMQTLLSRLAAGTASYGPTTPLSPQIVESVPLTDPFQSPSLQEARNLPKNSANVQSGLPKPPNFTTSRNTTQNDEVETSCPKARSNDEVTQQALQETLKELSPGGKRCVSPLTQLHTALLKEYEKPGIRVPNSLYEHWLADVPSIHEGGVSPLNYSHDETVGKRKRVDAQIEVSVDTSPKRNRFLWSIPAYDPSKDPTTKTAPTNMTANVTTNKPPPAPRPAFAVPVQRVPSIQSKIGSDAKKDETTTNSAVRKTIPAKSGHPHTAALDMLRDALAAKAVALNIPTRTTTAVSLIQESPLSTIPAATPTPRSKKGSKPWTSREYAELVTLAFDSFPFAAFAATHNKTEREVINAFSAIISLPVFQHSDNELARARFIRQKVAAYNQGFEDVKEVYRAEARANTLSAGRSGKRGRGTEEDRAVRGLGGGVLGKTVAKGPGRG